MWRFVTRTSQPPGICPPNLASPLLAGGTHLFSYYPLNLITQQLATLRGSTNHVTLKGYAKPLGLGADFGSSGSPYWSFSTAANQINAQNPWTIACLVAFPGTADTPIAIITDSINVAARDRGISVESGAFYGFLYDGATQSVTGPSIAANRVYNVVLSAGGGKLTMYVDGVQTGQVSVGNNGYAGYGAQPLFLIGHCSHADLAADGTCIVLMGLKTDNVYWGAAKVAEFYRNPWQVFAPIRVPRFYDAVAAGGGSSAVPALCLLGAGA